MFSMDYKLHQVDYPAAFEEQYKQAYEAAVITFKEFKAEADAELKKLQECQAK